MSDDTINVALCTDDNFIYPTLTTIDSVLKNKTDQRFSIFIITAGISVQSKNIIEKFSQKKTGTG